MPTEYVPRQCEHILDTGIQCGSPAMRGQDFCYYHRRAHSNILPGDSRYVLPVLETEEAIQLAATHISRSVLKGKLDRRDAQTLLQAIRIAQATLKYTKHDIINENADYQCTELTSGMEKLEAKSQADVEQESGDTCIAACADPINQLEGKNTVEEHVILTTSEVRRKEPVSADTTLSASGNSHHEPSPKLPRLSGNAKQRRRARRILERTLTKEALAV